MREQQQTTRIVRSLRNGQITIPAEFRRRLGIDGESLLRVTLEDGELRIKPLRVSGETTGSRWLKELYDLFALVRQEAEQYTEEEINTAIDEAVTDARRRNA